MELLINATNNIVDYAGIALTNFTQPEVNESYITVDVSEEPLISQTMIIIIAVVVVAAVIIVVFVIIKSKKPAEDPSGQDVRSFCGGCGAEIDANHTFCKKCGKNLPKNAIT